MTQLSVVILSLLDQMKRTYAIERAVHAWALAEAKRKRVGQPSFVDPDKLKYAEHLRNEGFSMSKIVEKTGITRSSLCRHPPRQVETHTPKTAGPNLTALRPWLVMAVCAQDFDVFRFCVRE